MGWGDEYETAPRQEDKIKTGRIFSFKTMSLVINKIKDEKLKAFVWGGTNPDYNQRFSSLLQMRKAFNTLNFETRFCMSLMLSPR